MKESKPTSRARRGQFATRLGVIAATVGSSIGLGNIWRFPYEAGAHGGGAFMLCYILFIIILGIPVICAEFVVGRAARTGIFGCFQRLGAGGRWRSLGVIGIVASMMILSFYSVVAGWTLEYLWQSASGGLDVIADSNGGFAGHFADFTSSSLRPVLWTLVFMAVNWLVVLGGVQKGIERVSNILMPLLFAIMVAFCINSLFMPGAREGLSFLFTPDFSKLTPSVVIGALGQAFFSLSIGLGCMLTYASYFTERTNLVKNAAITGVLDTTAAIMAGVLIFPAVFTYGMSPAEGPTLVFDVFPSIFHNMAGGQAWATLFFLMLFVASLTSTISMSEISIAFFTDERGMSRKKACNLSSGICAVFGVLCTLSFSGISNINIGSYTFRFFDFFNNVSSNVLLPVGGFFISIYAGRVLSRKVFNEEITNRYTLRHVPYRLIRFLLRWVCPTGIAIILLSSIGLL